MGQQVVLFHSALGLRPAVLGFAERLRDAGHIVSTPDSFDGEVFDALEGGVAKRDALGIQTLIERAQTAVADLPADIVLAGFSMGTGAAQYLAATLPGPKAAILMHGGLSPAAVGLEEWPGVPLQMHYADPDPFVEPDDLRALETAARATGVPVEVHSYPGLGHLFEDSGLSHYHPSAANLMVERVLGFLDRLDHAEG